MLFDFISFVESLRTKDDKKELVEKYEKFFGTLSWDIKDQQWFKEYVINFKPIPYRVPEELTDQFDRWLLIQLVASSFSSECFLEKPELKEGEKYPDDATKIVYDLTISVKNGDQVVVKKVIELWSFQIMRLYEIYIEEQMNLQVLTKEWTQEDVNAIMGQREYRVKRRKAMLETLGREKEAEQAKVEQESKLGDLMSQL